MTECVLEINDSEIRVALDGRIVHRSPGIAVVLDGTLQLGTAAARQAHLQPRHSYNRYWANLDQDALAVPTPRFRHHADLVHAHLLDLHERAGKPAQMLLAVPGSYSAGQLSLLLGIAQACPFRISGLVDSAVAALAAVAGPGHYNYLDVHLHHAVLTRVSIAEQVTRETVETIDNGGLAAIHDAVAELVADTFIQQSRFDPLHHADTEQALYDQIPRCLAALCSAQDAILEVTYERKRHQARLTRDALLARLERFYLPLVERLDEDCAPVLGERPGRLPGLAERIGSSHVVDENALFRACQIHADAICSDGPQLNFVTRLPPASSPEITSASAHSEAVTAVPLSLSRPAVTHLLSGHQAFPLQGMPIFLSPRGSVSRTRHDASACRVTVNGDGATVESVSDLSIYVNGERLTAPRTLLAGDKISFAGSDTVYSLICVSTPDAT